MIEKTWFTCEASGSTDAEVHIYDEIGMWGITAKDFHESLRALGPVSHIDLYINSPGGSVFDGISIYNMLKRHKAKITVHVDGIAASIASFIAMVGDEVIMPSNSMMMIHDPSGFVMGTSKEMRNLAQALDSMKTTMVAAYVGKSGLTEEEVSDLMSNETWMSAEEAVSYGFADEMGAEVQMAAMFDLSKFRNAPDSLVGDSINRGNPPPHQKEVSMTTKDKTAETPAEMEARIRSEVAAELKAEADKAEAGKAKGDKSKDDEGDVEARVRAEYAEIVSVCELAGFSAKASEFIAQGKKLPEVMKALRELKASGASQHQQQQNGSTLRTGLPQNNQQQDDGSGIPDKVVAELDAQSIWNRWNGKKQRVA